MNFQSSALPLVLHSSLKSHQIGMAKNMVENEENYIIPIFYTTKVLEILELFFLEL